MPMTNNGMNKLVEELGELQLRKATAGRSKRNKGKFSSNIPF